jgi:hypothetical protein
LPQRGLNKLYLTVKLDYEDVGTSEMSILFSSNVVELTVISVFGISLNRIDNVFYWIPHV